MRENKLCVCVLVDGSKKQRIVRSHDAAQIDRSVARFQRSDSVVLQEVVRESVCVCDQERRGGEIDKEKRKVQGQGQGQGLCRMRTGQEKRKEKEKPLRSNIVHAIMDESREFRRI